MRPEYCVEIKGQIVEREEEAKNKSMPTGDFEIHVTSLVILNKSDTPPFV